MGDLASSLRAKAYTKFKAKKQANNQAREARKTPGASGRPARQAPASRGGHMSIPSGEKPTLLS